ncbi:MULTISPECIES: hypothetical protein [unclassified Isoptericola]|uniref:hypothetical protein n=1 Tax=unclassified Isoptericola TaxID=2623355 RepID=UPI00365CA284
MSWTIELSPPDDAPPSSPAPASARPRAPGGVTALVCGALVCGALAGAAALTVVDHAGAGASGDAATLESHDPGRSAPVPAQRIGRGDFGTPPAAGR